MGNQRILGFIDATEPTHPTERFELGNWALSDVELKDEEILVATYNYYTYFFNHNFYDYSFNHNFYDYSFNHNFYDYSFNHNFYNYSFNYKF
ncbi:hypothetical protein FO519_009579 [Halicephalobus sp. NKZ332]|nr:hypothetical protein FO519_009579 [Halicephalobus sp. NKZ332]